MTAINQIKHERFAENWQKWLANHQVVNFEIIHDKCRSDILNKTLKKHQTISEMKLVSYPDVNKEKVVACARKTLRNDLYLYKKLTVKFWIKNSKFEMYICVQYLRQRENCSNQYKVV